MDPREDCGGAAARGLPAADGVRGAPEPRDRLPKRLWPDTRQRLRAIWEAPTRAACEARRDELALWLHGHGQDPAAETLYRDWDDFVTFYDFPAEHWLHLRTSNPIESIFAGVRLRTNVASAPGSARTPCTSCSRSSSVWRPAGGSSTAERRS